MAQIDHISYIVTPLTIFSGLSKVGTGTGFFYAYNNRLFLVTNKHVVIDEDEGHYPSKLQFKVHTNENDLQQIDLVEVELIQNSSPVWIQAADSNIDLALIDLTEYKKDNWVVLPLSSGFVPLNDIDLSLGLDLLALCFPVDFYDKFNNLPITRKATLSSNYGVKFNDSYSFLVDSKLDVGTSGCPIITMPSNCIKRISGTTTINSKTFFFLGVNCGQYGNLQLNSVHYSELIEWILTNKI